MLNNAVLKKIFSLPGRLVAVIIFALFFGQYLGENVMSWFYTFSYIFKQLLDIFLPIMVFSFILHGISLFRKKTPIIVIILLGFIFISNVIASTTAFIFGRTFLPFLTEGLEVTGLLTDTFLFPRIVVKIPQFIKMDVMVFSAIILGIFFAFVPWNFFDKSVIKLKDFMVKIIQKIFFPILPIYVLGYLLKTVHEHGFYILFKTLGRTFFLIFAIQAAVLLIMYLIATGFDLRKVFRSIFNFIPAYLTAFTCMSSAFTLPVTIECAIKNVNNKKLVNLLAPILANIHLVGDAIVIPILSMITFSMFMGQIPSVGTYLIFLVYFWILLFTVAAVPAGGIVATMPILISILGFSPAMISIITALFVIQDSFGTACNVMGDGAMIILVNKILRKFNILKDQELNNYEQVQNFSNRFWGQPQETSDLTKKS